ncbi:IclR family transcriptional regulator C-terminal domain-containing protein [Streptomyces sp. NPDC048636]|uniref:IclR family transcriptional regulator n=1 Tax=Streptomyces sp. NPDC048636 TaxID=3155762 RepID=UPI00343C74CD
MTVPLHPPAGHAAHQTPGAAEKVLLLLESFTELTASGARPTLTRIARGSGLAKSTTHRLLSLLVARRMIECAGGAYRRGPALAALADSTLGLPVDRLRTVLLPHMVDLYELTHETVSLAVVSGTDVVLIERVHGQRNHRSRPSVPDRAPVHRTALGRAMATARTHQRALGADAPVRPPRVAARADGLLAAARRQGISVSTDGVVPGVTCLALPVLDESRRPVAALSVSGVTHGMDIASVAKHLRAVSLTAGLSLLAEGA